MRFIAHTAVIILALLTVSCAHSDRNVASSAQDVQPLIAGKKVPLTTLLRADGEAVTTTGIFAKKPTVLVFYRGGWCPYCNTHLRELSVIESQLKDLGYQIVAVSPDLPEKLQTTATKEGLGYTLVSDSEMTLAQNMGIAFELDKATLTKYKSYKIKLEEWSGQTHSLLPVPSVFLIETDGTVAFQYVNPNYKTRLSGDVLLAAAKAARD